MHLSSFRFGGFERVSGRLLFSANSPWLRNFVACGQQATAAPPQVIMEIAMIIIIIIIINSKPRERPNEQTKSTQTQTPTHSCDASEIKRDHNSNSSAGFEHANHQVRSGSEHTFGQLTWIFERSLRWLNLFECCSFYLRSLAAFNGFQWFSLAFARFACHSLASAKGADLAPEVAHSKGKLCGFI